MDNELDINVYVERVKKRFGKYKSIQANIKRLETKLMILDERITSVSSIKYSDEPKGGKPVTLDDMLVDKEDLVNRINKLKDKRKRIKDSITSEIDRLDDSVSSEILELYFIDCFPMYKVSEIMGYTERYTYHLYRQALIKVACNLSQ